MCIFHEKSSTVFKTVHFHKCNEKNNHCKLRTSACLLILKNISSYTGSSRICKNKPCCPTRVATFFSHFTRSQCVMFFLRLWALCRVKQNFDLVHLIGQIRTRSADPALSLVHGGNTTPIYMTWGSYC